MSRLNCAGTKLLLVNVIAFIVIFSAIVTLPVCGADAYSPFTSDTDLQTISEHRSLTVIETHPGVHVVHDFSGKSCPVCSSSDPGSSDHIPSRSDSPIERFAVMSQGSAISETKSTIQDRQIVSDLRALSPGPTSPPPQH